MVNHRTYTKLSHLIAEYYGINNYPQENIKFAGELGVSPATVDNWRKGKSEPKFTMGLKIVEILIAPNSEYKTLFDFYKPEMRAAA